MKTIYSLLAVILLSSFNLADEVVKVGDVAPDFTLKNIDGNMVSLSDFGENKGVILIFSCNTCPFVVKYEDRMIELDNAFREMGYPVVAINPNDVSIKPGDSYEEMVKRADALDFPFDYLYDETQEIAEAYGATRTPQVYLLKNMDGEFQVAYIGAIDNSVESADAVTEAYVENAIESLENGDVPNPDFTKAIGCTIKWKPAEN
ncbi:MAG: thioredoxin family protein [Chitinophagales bacterium]|nr:thioredoxin family protein [Chitinophagales bacterium]